MILWMMVDSPSMMRCLSFLLVLSSASTRSSGVQGQEVREGGALHARAGLATPSRGQTSSTSLAFTQKFGGNLVSGWIGWPGQLGDMTEHARLG